MAVIKAVSSKAGIGTVCDYVTKDEKTQSKLLSGLNCQPESAKAEMQATKELWNKTDGRTYKHFVQSFAPEEHLDPELAHKIACEFAGKCKQFQGFEVLIATHQDREHIHTHFVLNSVSFEDGHKFRMHKDELQQMKDLSDSICKEYDLSICEKGRTFDGQEREETTAYIKETYRMLQRAEKGEVKSYVQDIAMAVMDCREQATSRDMFIQLMLERGYKTDWKDNHKYITWTDLARENAGEKACKIRDNKLEKYYNIEFGKESLEHEFEANAQREQAREQTDRARQQLANVSRGAEPDHSRPAERNSRPAEQTSRAETREFLDNIRAKVGSAEAGRQERDAERSRRSAEAERRARETERKLAEAKARSFERSRSEGISR